MGHSNNVSLSASLHGPTQSNMDWRGQIENRLRGFQIRWVMAGFNLQPMGSVDEQIKLSVLLFVKWSQEEAGLTVMLADDWSRNKVRWGCHVPSGFSEAAGGRPVPTVTGSGVWARWGLVSGVLVGGEGGEGGGRGTRQSGGLRTDGSRRRRVCHRLRDAGEEERRRGLNQHVTTDRSKWALSRWASPDHVAAAVGGICHPSNKKLLWGSVRLHSSWETSVT